MNNHNTEMSFNSEEISLNDGLILIDKIGKK